MRYIRETVTISRYGRGLVPLGQLLEAQMRLNDARHQLILSQYNKKAAHGRLLMLTNELIKPFTPAPKTKVVALKDIGVLKNGK